MALLRTFPPPTYILLPSLMVEIYLVLAPDVNFFLNPQQGLPCWRSLFFIFIIGQDSWILIHCIYLVAQLTCTSSTK